MATRMIPTISFPQSTTLMNTSTFISYLNNRHANFVSIIPRLLLHSFEHTQIQLYQRYFGNHRIIDAHELESHYEAFYHRNGSNKLIVCGVIIIACVIAYAIPSSILIPYALRFIENRDSQENLIMCTLLIISPLLSSLSGALTRRALKTIIHNRYQAIEASIEHAPNEPSIRLTDLTDTALDQSALLLINDETARRKRLQREWDQIQRNVRRETTLAGTSTENILTSIGSPTDTLLQNSHEHRLTIEELPDEDISDSSQAVNNIPELIPIDLQHSVALQNRRGWCTLL